MRSRATLNLRHKPTTNPPPLPANARLGGGNFGDSGQTLPQNLIPQSAYSASAQAALNPVREMPRSQRDLLRFLGQYLNAEAVAKIKAACDFGAQAHRGQTRISGEAYIEHPVAVARILGEMRMDSRSIIAAVLHDVIEDTDITLPQLAQQFGDDVAELVDGVSKVSQLEQDSKERVEAASFHKMFMATARDIRVIIIKLCDRLHNMRTLGALRITKRRRVARQTLDIYAPIANRLGMRELAQQLEDLGLRNLYPKRHDAITKKLQSTKRGRKPIIKEALQNIEKHLTQAGINAEVSGREKDIYSIYCKMKRKKLALQEVKDIHAIRVVLEARPDCYRALGVIHKLYKPLPGRFRDYIAIPKVNGYQSLHTVVVGPFGQPIEVQIRSYAMHRIAETGIASHWLYKTETSGEHAPQELAQQWLSSFLESQQKSVDAGEFLEHLKADLFPDEVYVFTPKGEIKRLPRNATALDFAYTVHTGVGDRSVQARINGHQVPLHQTLSNGDHVEIITARHARPLPAWLEYAVSAKARSAIRHHLNSQKSKEALKLGNRLLKQALRKQGYWRIRIAEAHKKALLAHFQLQHWDELLSDIGYGKRMPILVAKQIILESSHLDHPEHAATAANVRMSIDGTERLLVNYPSCCHPIPGDNIVGIATHGRGLVVHRSNCPNHRKTMNHTDNYFPLSWSSQIKGKFQVVIRMETRNAPGVLASVSNIIAEYKSNINSLQVDPHHNNTSSMRFTIEVSGRKHLADIMRKLRQKRAVLQLARA